MSYSFKKMAFKTNLFRINKNNANVKINISKTILFGKENQS